MAFSNLRRKDSCDGKYWILGSDEEIPDIMLCAGVAKNSSCNRTVNSNDNHIISSQVEMEQKMLVRGTVGVL